MKRLNPVENSSNSKKLKQQSIFSSFQKAIEISKWIIQFGQEKYSDAENISEVTEIHTIFELSIKQCLQQVLFNFN